MLDGNPIKQVPDGAFLRLDMLTSLSLSRMAELVDVNGAALRGLDSLQRLRISHNHHLTKVHRTLLVGEDAAQHDWKLVDVSDPPTQGTCRVKL